MDPIQIRPQKMKIRLVPSEIDLFFAYSFVAYSVHPCLSQNATNAVLRMRPKWKKLGQCPTHTPCSKIISAEQRHKFKILNR